MDWHELKGTAELCDLGKEIEEWTHEHCGCMTDVREATTRMLILEVDKLMKKVEALEKRLDGQEKK